MSFRLVPKSVTLNDLERHNGIILGYVISANSGSFRAHCVKVHVRYLISWRVLVFLVPVSLIFVRPFVKRFALSYFGPFSVLSVCDVGLLWPNGWMDQDATWYGGRGLGPGHIVTWRVGVGDGVPLIHIRKGAQQPPTFRPTLLWHGRPSQQLLSSCFLFGSVR